MVVETLAEACRKEQAERKCAAPQPEYGFGTDLPGFFFVRVFEKGPAALSGSVAYYYYEFGPVAAQDTFSMAPQLIEINRDLAFEGHGDLLSVALLGGEP